MIYIKSPEEGVELFKVLGSEVRVGIIRLLLENREMNMNEIAGRLNITNGALTSHIRKMEDVGLIEVTPDFTGHGNQKICRIRQRRILVDIEPQETDGRSGVYEAEVPVGQYTDYSVLPTCGISTTKSLIGRWTIPGTSPILTGSMRGSCGFPEALWNISFPACFRPCRR